MEHLTKETLQKKVFNYEKNRDWKFEGKLPCVVDFYADWCGPCKMVAPILEELAKEYDGKLDIYKVDIEDQQEIATAFSVRSIPLILLCPKNDKPQIIQGVRSKESFEKSFKDILKIK